MSDATRDPAHDLQRGSAGDPDASATTPRRRGAIPGGDTGRGEVRHRRAVGWRSRDVVRAAALVFAMYLALRLFWFANALFLTLFLGILFGIAVSAGVDRLQRFRIPRGIAAALIVLTFFGLLGAFGASVAPTLREQGGELRQKLPEAVSRVQQWVNKRQSGMLGVLFGRPPAAGPTAAPGATTAGRAPAATGGAAGATAAQPPAGSPATATPATGAPAAGAAGAQGSGAGSPGAPEVSGPIGEQFGSVTRFLFPFAKSTVAAVGGFLLIVFLSIYFASDPELYRRGALALLPMRRRAEGAKVMDRIGVVLKKWLVTQLIAMAAIGTVSTVALLILDVKAALALGVLAGLFEFIPTVGPILSAIPAIAMGFLDSPEKALIVAVVYMGIQFLENHILIPLLMKGGMDLPPALTVLAQALLALVFGFLGLMVAVPMLATVMVVVQMFYVQREPDVAPAEARPEGFDPALDEPLEGPAPARA